MKKRKQYGRVQAQFNTGTRVERPAKGKGSYTRKKKHKSL